MSAVAMLIEDWGYECMAVSSPAQAADALGSRLGDVVAVVADVSVKESYTGGRSAAAIAATVGSEVPVIATSSYPRLAIANGFATVLAKPYEPEQLREWLVAQFANEDGARKAS